MIKRYISSMAIATVVTFGLFTLMQRLVESGDSRLTEDDGLRLVDMVQVDREIETIRKERTVEKPDDVTPPPDMDIPQVQTLRPGATSVAFSGAQVNAGVDIGGASFGGVSDGDYLPIVKVQPQYPRRAAERGVEGYVLLEFTVTALGTVENPTVIEADPPGYFERAAIRAALKFKYKAKVVNGEPMAVAGVRNLITFELAD